ncbi:MAG: nitrogenase iron-molybdenum cofactor biosynthesis protein NifN [Campylobacterales bacterium]|nr:nitrogenase iron-molybdenum cofactor biosynthesis protein NifN [Campylobacterales bacterium]
MGSELAPKPLSINPFKLSMPMGATLAFLGVKGCMPLMHGAQGCASFTKVFFTRHFNEPIAIQTTAVNDITAVFDGGEYGVTTAVENITKKVTPSLIGLYSTGLTETKGDDLRGAADKIESKIVWANTPDFEGSFESGWSVSVLAMIEQLIKETSEIEPKKITVIPNVSMSALEVERLKEFLYDMGFLRVFALPDISTSLDGYLGEKQGQISSGGIEVDDLEALGNSEIVVTVGMSVKDCGDAFVAKNQKIKHLHMDSLGGLINTDNFVSMLMEAGYTPNGRIKRWRARLQDAMLDTHFVIGKHSFLIAVEPDNARALADTLREAGAKIESITLPQKVNFGFENYKNVSIGDLEDVSKNLANIDVIVTNEHGKSIATSQHKTILLRGFPIFEALGHSLKSDILYEGSAQLLFETANLIEEHHH